MKDIYFTIAGCRYRYGSDFLKEGMSVKLIKEPDNEVDKEAIRVEVEGLGLIGYVANSVHTVLGDSFSAGRLYDHIGDTAGGTVKFVLENGVVCRLHNSSVVRRYD